MNLHLYNSLTRRLESFQPISPDHVGYYSCGPTVYNYAHIGNFRAYTFEDILHRTLAYAGYTVIQVMNLTDVDDKTIRGSRQSGIPLKQYTAPYIQAFFDDSKALNITPAQIYPAATDHIPEMIALVQKLFDKGLAYKSPDGSVYFSVGKHPTYGKLAHLDRDNLRVGVRMNQDEYDKESFGDFALWKGWDQNDGDVVWDAPWGKGRPGWHIECSAMSMKYLGETFDLHTGGIDNLFPHHENEIAQAEGATGKPFVKTWLHCAHLRVNGEKMSKSLGNFFTLRDLLAKGYTGREIRLVLISAHYRQPLNFTFDALAAAKTSLERLDDCLDRLETLAAGTNPAEPLPGAKLVDQFDTAIADDLNTPEALAAFWKLVREANTEATPTNAAGYLQQFHRLDRILGIVDFGRRPKETIPPEIQTLAQARQKARAEKNWAESDRIRDLLAQKGWQVRDSKDGQTLKPIHA
ncbi:MAG: cysteine--tRNA ligase [Kiritimatiellia bacterium]